ncbi:MAG: glycosyltransferase family 4 protein [bacterium]|nr:glycosyltransferase family 4 protein [bacterium]
MRIGFLIFGNAAIGNPYNGIREQAFFQAHALRELGCEVDLLNPWERNPLDTYHSVHFYGSGPSMHGIQTRTPVPIKHLVFSPIIDSIQPNFAYRLSSYLGSFSNRIHTVQSFVREQAQASSRSLARSTHEKDKLVYGLGIPEQKVAIVLNGCPTPETVDPTPVLKRFGINSRFALHISCVTNEVKNVVNMIDAIGPTKVPLVLAGTMNEGSTKTAIMSRLIKFPNVKFLGHVDTATKNALYSACELFCLPSRAEGTGLVAVEAASYGAKVMITRNGGPPDYFGEHAFYTTKGNVRDINDVFIRAWESPKTCELQTHIVQNLTWQKSAEALLDVYQGLTDS